MQDSADSSGAEVTQLLKAWGHGDEDALGRLIPVVQKELHRIAHYYMLRERPDHTLQTTALVNEVYLRLVAMPHMSWQDRAHFFAHLSAHDASHPHRFCPVSQLPEAGRSRAACVFRRSSSGPARA
jgi:hypothetical protein